MQSTIMMKEAGATLPIDGVPVTRTVNILCKKHMVHADSVKTFGICPCGFH